MTSSDALTLLHAIDDAVKFNPSKWERDFLLSIREQTYYEKSLSSKQSEVLQNIYRKAYKDEY